MRINLPPHLATLVDRYAKVYNVAPHEAMARLLDAVETRLAGGFSVAEIGLDWDRIATELRPRSVFAGSPDTGQTQPEKATFVPLSEIDAPTAEQLQQLERSEKLSSGYAGVYANGKLGWRSQVVVVDEGAPSGRTTRRKFLPTRPSPELAAWDRFQYHLQHNLPYGELAVTLEYLRSRHPEMPEAELLAMAREMDDLKATK